MQTGKPLYLRFRRREDTCSREHVWRSFYKMVAKERLYYPAHLTSGYLFSYVLEGNFRYPRKGFKSRSFGSGWGIQGMPTFRDYRSNVYTLWQSRFREHRERWEADAEVKRQLETAKYWEEHPIHEQTEWEKFCVEYRRKQEEKYAARAGRKRVKSHTKDTVSVFQHLAASGIFQQ